MSDNETVLRQGEEENILSREWQQTRFKKYVLPDAVYYQSLWAVRDLERMEERIKELSDTRDAMEISGSLVKDGGADYPEGRRPTEKTAIERVMLEERVRGIRDAIESIPEGYKSYVLSNVILKNSGKTFPNKVWRIWKQRFLYDVAVNLAIL